MSSPRKRRQKGPIKKVLFTGARSWENEEAVETVINRLIAQYGTQRLIIIEGGAPGLDKIAWKICEKKGIHCLEMKALWSVFNHAAGPIRNRMMLALEPDLVVGFHWDLKDSKGTKDCLEQAEALGIRTALIRLPRLRAILSAADYLAKQKAKKRQRKQKNTKW